jgi:potassium-transporting ATPase KdpC subunit
MRAHLRPALVLLAAFTAITGLAYPGLVTLVARVAWPRQATGSLVIRDGRPVGSALVGQPFTAPRYFWGRPSATRPVPYDGAASAGSNLGPSNPALAESVAARLRALRAGDPDAAPAVPVDLVTASASGLDPDISPAAAAYQVDRVARARGLPVDLVRTLVARHVEGRAFGVLGERRVSVLLLNLALDSLTTVRAPR